MEIVRQRGGCIQLLHSLEEINRPYLLISDVHFDSPKCERKMLQRHLDEAVKLNAGILSFGDFFDAMQGREDRRRNKSDLRPENKRADYLDSLVEEASNFLAPYRDNLVLFTQGNHESSVLNKLETDLLKRLVDTMGGKTLYGGYQGFIRFSHKVSTTSTRGTTLFWHHGGFHGTITKGTLAINRYASIAPDADIVVSGDTHDRWQAEHPMYRLTQNGTTKVVPQLHIKVGNYKNDFESGSGWAQEKIIFPKSLGGWWLRFENINDRIQPIATMTT